MTPPISTTKQSTTDPAIQAMNWLETVSHDHNRLGLLIIRTYQDDGFGLLVEFVAWILERGYFDDNPLFLQPQPLANDAPEEVATAWLSHHIETDPTLAALFEKAAQTSWRPIVRFTAWAVENGLLSNVHRHGKSAPLGSPRALRGPKGRVPLGSRSLQKVGDRSNASRSNVPLPGADAGAYSATLDTPRGLQSALPIAPPGVRAYAGKENEGSGEQPAPRRGSGQTQSLSRVEGSPVSSVFPASAHGRAS